MSTELSKAIEVLATGNLAKLSDAEKTAHYMNVCESMGLNPLTRPFEYITLNGKLALYARKDATDQLRRINHVSIEEPKITFQDQWIIVTVVARDKDGRTDSDVGVVNKTDMQGNYGNALMKCITKAKRRVTLSICGLGMLDETEVETIPNVQVHQEPAKALPAKPTQSGGQQQEPPTPGYAEYLLDLIKDATTDELLNAVTEEIKTNKHKLIETDLSALRATMTAKRAQLKG